MYKRILLAYDGSVEGRKALREGALLAKRCGAKIYLLSVAGGGAGVQLADGAYAGAGAQHHAKLQAIFDESVDRLKLMGFAPVARLVEGGIQRRLPDRSNRMQPPRRPQRHHRRRL